ncbi:hypothetical protein INT43_001476 [Umbelopsis isabellina]|uniref:RING-type domain-containing protein n=1 Tax=Mortierella isabellina TaxID=91625 RepID=A0A8H7UA11_MORIS|nr:hypothetical protein INT43_001476 [Umbelopsis isabellina]
MGQAFSNTASAPFTNGTSSSDSSHDQATVNDFGPDATAWTSAVSRSELTPSPSTTTTRRVLRSQTSNRSSRRPNISFNPLRYERPPSPASAPSTSSPSPRLLTRLHQRLRRPTSNTSETSSLVSPAASLMDIEPMEPSISNGIFGTPPTAISANEDEDEEETSTAGGSERTALSRLLTQVITTAVLDSLNRPGNQEQEQERTQGVDEEGNGEWIPRHIFTGQGQREVEGRSSDLGSFFRMLRMPTSTFRNSGNEGEEGTSGEGDDHGEGDTMPVFILGYRATRSHSGVGHDDDDQQQGEAAGVGGGSHSGQGRRWIIYIISGTNQPLVGGENNNSGLPASLFGDNPTYEDLLSLSHFLGPVRPVTATQGQIDRIPITVYHKQAMTEMLNDKCQVCLEEYAESQELRMLQCKHGFHKDCVDRWLMEGRNCCPICRGVPVSDTDSDTSTNHTASA